MGERIEADGVIYRASFTSVVIVRSSDSRMEKPNPSSCSARTLAVLHGPSFSEDNTRRVSLRYGISWGLDTVNGVDGVKTWMLTYL